MFVAGAGIPPLVAALKMSLGADPMGAIYNAHYQRKPLERHAKLKVELLTFRLEDCRPVRPARR